MARESILATGLVLVAFIIWFCFKHFLASCRPKNFPPGPPTAPFFGNLLQLPTKKGFLKFHELGKQYGTIVGLKLGPQNAVVLNNFKHVKALFEKKGGIYSSRPENHIGNDIVCPGSTHILLLPYGDAWRKQRKVVQSLLNINAVDKLLPIQNAEASQTMFQLAQTPEDYFDHIRRYSTAVILTSVFGQRGATFDSPKVHALYHAQDQFTAILEQGATPPVDFFPFLKHLPDFLCPWRTWARSIRREQRSLYHSLLQETKEKIARGKASDCFMKQLLDKQEKEGFDDEHVAYLGGSDTTASTLLSFVLAMIKYPHTLKKAQSEVDYICGEFRSPTSNDINKLTYLRACMNETLRWRPVAAGGIPHMLTEDDTYEGYSLPKGTVLFANAWSIHRDEDEYVQPEEFMPERFMENKFGSSYQDGEAPDDHRRLTYSFGAGRRVCAGQRLAENSLMVNMAKIVWAFDLTPGSTGVDVNIETAYSDGFLISPKKFPVKITPRSDRHREVIGEEYEWAKTQFVEYED